MDILQQGRAGDRGCSPSVELHAHTWTSIASIGVGGLLLARVAFMLQIGNDLVDELAIEPPCTVVP